jgi:hypothetical protein
MTDRELAEAIWEIVKGRTLPKDWSNEQVEQIIKRYWHRAMAKAEG